MPAPNVDLVLVVDTSDSMKHCIDELRSHLDAILNPMQGNVSKVRYALVGMSASKYQDNISYMVNFVKGPLDFKSNNPYHLGPNDPDSRNQFFTESAQELKTSLSRLVATGDEDMLLALDFAADLPFGSISNTKRVVALFSDEPFEQGVSGRDNFDKLPKLCEKFQARHIQLFAAVPKGHAAEELSQIDRSEIEFIDGGNGLKNVDFSRLFSQMGKSISASTLQAVSEPSYERALFSQDEWVEGEGWSDKDNT
jgi:hypothetical protein